MRNGQPFTKANQVELIKVEKRLRKDCDLLKRKLIMKQHCKKPEEANSLKKLGARTIGMCGLNNKPRKQTTIQQWCHAPLHEECPKHHGHKGGPGVTPGTCGAVGERAQVILVWVRAPGVGNASHPQRLGGTRVRP